MNRDERRRLEDILRGYCQHIPPGVNNGSATNAAAFKEAVAEGAKVLKKAAPTEQQLHAAINRIHVYWQ